MFNFETGRLSEPLLFWFWKGYQFSEKIILIKALDVRGALVKHLKSWQRQLFDRRLLQRAM